MRAVQTLVSSVSTPARTFSSHNTPNVSSFFFFTNTPPPETYTLSLHDALPISAELGRAGTCVSLPADLSTEAGARALRSEEHTSELQSRLHLVCRLLLEKKKKENDTLTVE